MKWAQAIVLLVSAVPILTLAGCTGSQGEEVSLEAPAELTVLRHSEDGISFLRWASPAYEVANYEIEWRFADVPHWTALSGLEISGSRVGDDTSIEASGNALTRGVDVEYCYRVRAVNSGGEASEWSKEDCAVNGAWWWTVPAGNPPGHILDLTLREAGTSIELEWRLETIPGADSTSGIEVWRRPAGSPVYETMAELPPVPLSPEVMTFDDEGAANGSYCYRLAVLSSRGGQRLLDEVCSAAASQ